MALFVTLVLMGGLWIMSIMLPNIWSNLVADWKVVSNFIKSIPIAIYNLLVGGLLEGPNKLLPSVQSSTPSTPGNTSPATTGK